MSGIPETHRQSALCNLPTEMATTTDTPQTSSTGFGEPLRVPSRFPYRTIAMGTVGSTLLMVAALGAGGILIKDPVLGHGPLSWVRYGHGRALANLLLYTGFGLVVWAWVRLGGPFSAEPRPTVGVVVAGVWSVGAER